MPLSSLLVTLSVMGGKENSLFQTSRQRDAAQLLFDDGTNSVRGN
jgi:hypothetical protein